MIFSIIFLIYFSYNIYTINKNYNEIDKVNEEIEEIYTENKIKTVENNNMEKQISEFKIKWESLINENNDIIAWIIIPNSKINYPILQSKQSSDEYLKKNIYKKYSSGGSIFIDYNLENPFDCVNTVVYGHNMNNGSMFSNLTKYKDEQYALENNTVLIYLPSGVMKKYNIFSFSEIDSNNVFIYNTDIENSQKHYNNIIKNSKYNLLKDNENFDTMQFLTLSTCTNKNKDKRYIVHAYLIK